MSVFNSSALRERGRILIVSGIFLLVSVSATAQAQELKQLQLNIQKLAQLKAMLSNMYSGYIILSNGYENIKNQSLANFNLHKGFIDALSLVSPAVKNSPSVFAILSLQSQIVSEYNTVLVAVKKTGLLSPAELEELTTACALILKQSSQNLTALQQLLTPGKLQLSEAERINILESLRSDMEKKLADIRTFTVQANQLSILKAKIKKDNQLLRNQYGIVK